MASQKERACADGTDMESHQIRTSTLRPGLSKVSASGARLGRVGVWGLSQAAHCLHVNTRACDMKMLPPAGWSVLKRIPKREASQRTERERSLRSEG